MNYVINFEDVPPLENKILYFYFPEFIFLEKFKKMISSMEGEDSSLNFFAVNIRSDISLKKRFNLVSIPTIIVFKKFKERNRCEGLLPFKELKKIIYT